MFEINNGALINLICQAFDNLNYLINQDIKIENKNSYPVIGLTLVLN